MGFPLPDELAGLTFSHLDVPSLLRCMQVSSQKVQVTVPPADTFIVLSKQGLQTIPIHHLGKHPVDLQDRVVRILHG